MDVLTSIRAAVAGDVSVVAELTDVVHADLIDAASDAGHLIVTPSAVLRALESLRRGEVSADEIHRWAWFVMRGYIPGTSDGALQPLEIDFQQDTEGDIAATLFRLSELGDEVDGALEPGELEHLAHRLSGS